MKTETKIRKALIRLYWQAHNDGGLAEFDNNIREHLHSQKWAARRAEVVEEALQKIQSAQQGAHLTAATLRKAGAISKMKAAGASRSPVTQTVGRLRHQKRSKNEICDRKQR